VTQERRQDERRRRRLARQQQKRQGRGLAGAGSAGDVEFGGVMGWFQRNTRWIFLAVIVLFIGGGVGSTFYTPAPVIPTPTPSPSATATSSSTASATPTATPTRTPDPSIQRKFTGPPPTTIDPNKTYTAIIKLEKGGEIRIELLPKDAIQSVNNFVFLARNRFYEGLTFHRVLPGFVAQGGDPQGDGFGGPGYVLPPDKNSQKFDPGVIAMAKSSAGVSGSQFFITLAPTPSLQDQFAVFGRVTQGMDVVQKITPRDPEKPAQPVGDYIASIQIVEGN